MTSHRQASAFLQIVSIIARHDRNLSQSAEHGQTYHSCVQLLIALLNPKTSIFNQKRHPYAGNLNLETPGDSKTAFLHCGDTLADHRADLLVQVTTLISKHDEA